MPNSTRVWFIGADHAGFELKDALQRELLAWGDAVTDLGTNSAASVHYPAFGADVARHVVATPGSLGLVVCGSGIGISIAANKVDGCRCALAHDAYTAHVAREHNDANVLALGSRVVGLGVAISALREFRDTEFAGERHAHRVAMLNALELGKE